MGLVSYECDCQCCGNHIQYKSKNLKGTYLFKGLEVVRHSCLMCGAEFLVNIKNPSAKPIMTYNNRDLYPLCG